MEFIFRVSHDSVSKIVAVRPQEARRLHPLTFTARNEGLKYKEKWIKGKEERTWGREKENEDDQRKQINLSPFAGNTSQKRKKTKKTNHNKRKKNKNKNRNKNNEKKNDRMKGKKNMEKKNCQSPSLHPSVLSLVHLPVFARPPYRLAAAHVRIVKK